MNNMFEPLNDDELSWLDDFLLERIDDDADFEGKDEGVSFFFAGVASW
jgi:hypothetical protein